MRKPTADGPENVIFYIIPFWDCVGWWADLKERRSFWCYAQIVDWSRVVEGSGYGTDLKGRR